ncbi:hypothetical protein RSAG8_09639, partial [Rhizoctonia solani AG-8 WAC10335]
MPIKARWLRPGLFIVLSRLCQQSSASLCHLAMIGPPSFSARLAGIPILPALSFIIHKTIAAGQHGKVAVCGARGRIYYRFIVIDGASVNFNVPRNVTTVAWWAMYRNTTQMTKWNCIQVSSQPE